MRSFRDLTLVCVLLPIAATSAGAIGPVGYYRQPALYQDTLVFVSEGDLWKVRLPGGVATRLTSHPGEESLPAISPDGQTLAFVASYEGPSEIYTMPLAGGPPRRRTFDGGHITFVGWTPDGRILYATDQYATLPNQQLITLDLSRSDLSPARTPVPLAQAADGCYDETGTTGIFVPSPAAEREPLDSRSACPRYSAPVRLFDRSLMDIAPFWSRAPLGRRPCGETELGSQPPGNLFDRLVHLGYTSGTEEEVVLAFR
jgi:hypothetical protein